MFLTSLHAAASLTRTMLRVSSIAPTARPIDSWKWHDTTPAPPPALFRWRIDRTSSHAFQTDPHLRYFGRTVGLLLVVHSIPALCSG